MDRTFGSHSFALVGVLDPERDCLGQIISTLTTSPTSASMRMAADRSAVFQLPTAATVAGVCAVTVRDELVYVGECQNLSPTMPDQSSEGLNGATLIGGGVRRRQEIDPSESLPWRYPIGKNQAKSFWQSRCVPSVRDRGVAGSNPVIPTNFHKGIYRSHG